MFITNNIKKGVQSERTQLNTKKHNEVSIL